MSGKPCDKPFKGPVRLNEVFHKSKSIIIPCLQAIVLNKEQDAFDAIMGRQVKEGHVVVIRYEGPKGRCAQDTVHMGSLELNFLNDVYILYKARNVAGTFIVLGCQRCCHLVQQ